MTAAHRFDRARPRLVRLAYSQLGDLTEAEDVVPEAWLRLERASPDSIHDLDAWLTTVVGRLALDTLRSARARREAYVGPWLPEPVASSGGEDPADRVTLDESVSYALLVLLEQLSPAERTAFVLHDVFDVPFPEIAQVVGRTPGAVRQLASRARRHVAEQRPRFEASPQEHDRAVRAFAHAVDDGDLDGLVAVLDPDVVWTSDGGGLAIASRVPIYGADRVARGWAALRRKGSIESNATPVQLNGRLGLLIAGSDGNGSALSFTVDRGRISRIDVVRNPDKLRRLARRTGTGASSTGQTLVRRPVRRSPASRARDESDRPPERDGGRRISPTG